MEIILTIKNLITGKIFDKTFNDLYEVKKFIHKCKFSKKVKVIGQAGYYTLADYNYANGRRLDYGY